MDSPTEKAAADAGSPPRVLLVDDQPDILELMAMLLEAEGLAVVTAPDGEAGFVLALQSNFNAFVLDVSMPRKDGIELAMALRAAPSTRHVPIVFHTSLGESQVRDRFTDYNAFLRKPVDPDQLIAAVKSLLLQQAAEHVS